MKNPSTRLICVSVHYTHTVCLWPISLCSSSRLCCIFFTYKEDISVLRTSSVCKSVKSLTSGTGQSLSFKSCLPKKRRGPHLGKLISLAWPQLVVKLWRDTSCILFCWQGYYIYLVMRRSTVVAFAVRWWNKFCAGRWWDESRTSGVLESDVFHRW